MIKKRLVVKNGSYTNKDGQEKTNWLVIGHEHEHSEFGTFYTLDAHINLAAIPRKEGDTRVIVNAYDVDDKKSFKGDNNDVPF
ncbi:MAG TPA: hypothetical protein DG048_24845 [Pseudoalteromonas sp.]|nr:hypothetical protein [Pseudoalteromonas sp.]|tara:strand:+ start:233 stop:481 length:249 start_codon:yes stop_codon:yes gene_type:complete